MSLKFTGNLEQDFQLFKNHRTEQQRSGACSKCSSNVMCKLVDTQEQMAALIVDGPRALMIVKLSQEGEAGARKIQDALDTAMMDLAPANTPKGMLN